jgi:hypothetical protein
MEDSIYLENIDNDEIENTIVDTDIPEANVGLNIPENWEHEQKDKDEIENDAILDMMFDDSFIEAHSSPFKFFPDDKQEFIGKSKFVKVEKVVQLYRNGDIDERMLHVLEIVIQHKYITTRQIWQMYLLKFGLYIQRLNLKKLLNRMAGLGLVVEFIIKSALGETSYHIYCADHNGVILYTALTSENINWKNTDTIQKTYIIKRSLAKNQFLIAYLKHYNFDYKLQPKLMSIDEKQHEIAVIPALQLIFKLKDKLDSVVFWVEVIRTYTGWQSDYSEKLIRFGKYMKSIEDTQALKKYYIIICAETSEQIKEAAQIIYELKYIKNIQEIRDLKVFYTSDLELLDTHIENSLLDNLHSLEFNYEKNIWEKSQMNFEFTNRDWHSREFKREIVCQDEKYGSEEDFCKDELLNEKLELAIKIYKVIVNRGWEFPQSITRIAVPLKNAGIDYSRMGYNRLKELFLSISEFFVIEDNGTKERYINCTDELRKHIKSMGLDISSENYQTQDDYAELFSRLEIGSREGVDIIADYFTNYSENQTIKKELKRNLTKDIYCYRDWEKSASLLAKMTFVNDLNKNGWFNIIAYSYQIAKNEGKVYSNSMGTNICFDTGLYTLNNEKIYLLAKKNTYSDPKWLLEGFSTALPEYNYNHTV